MLGDARETVQVSLGSRYRQQRPQCTWQSVSEVQGFVGHDVYLYSVGLHVCAHAGVYIWACTRVCMSATCVLCMKTNVCALHIYPCAMSVCMCVHVCENMLCVCVCVCVYVHTCMQAHSLSGRRKGQTGLCCSSWVRCDMAGQSRGMKDSR